MLCQKFSLINIYKEIIIDTVNMQDNLCRLE